MNSTEQKKILVVAESINVEDSSGSKANVALIENLKDAGFEILVAHYTRKEIELSGTKCVAIKEKKFNSSYLLSRVQRKIQHGFQVNLAKYLEPVFGFSFTFLNDSESIAAGVRQLGDFNPDLVLTLSKGASFRPHHALLNIPELHKKWMAYIHDPYPFHYYPEPYDWSEPGYRQKIDFFEQVAEKCHWTAYPSLLLAEWMEEKFPLFREKRVIIPHQLREENVPIELPEYFNPKKFNLLHAGNLMKQRPPFGLIEGFQKFLENNREARLHSRLLLIGNSGYHKDKLETYQQKIEELYISDGYVQYEKVLQMQRNASANIILESKAVISPFLPGKFPHCIAAEKPILHLGPEKSELRRLLGEDYQFWAEIDNIEKIAEFIEVLYRKWRKDAIILELKRADLRFYLSEVYLKEKLEKIL